jgi:hypothetical protein
MEMSGQFQASVVLTPKNKMLHGSYKREVSCPATNPTIALSTYLKLGLFADQDIPAL